MARPRVLPTTTAEYRAYLAATESEEEFKDRLIQRAMALGWLVMHSRPAMDRAGNWKTPLQGNAGFPDLVLARDGRVWFLELKSARGGVRPEQRLWLEALPPEWTAVLRPADFERVERMLQ